MFFAQSTIDKQKVAIKKMAHTTEKEILANLSEIGFLTLFKHPNIVKYISAYRVKREIWVHVEIETNVCSLSWNLWKEEP